MKNRYLYILILGALLTACSGHMEVSNPQLQEAESLLWEAPLRSDTLLNTLAHANLNRYENKRLELLKAHLDLKLRQQLQSEESMQALASWFASHQDAASAAEVYYIIGAYANWTGDNTTAMRQLKEAERLQPTGIIAGMTYYKMGRINEEEQLYEEAESYYSRAAEYITPTNLPLYQACVWRELGRMRSDSSKNACFEKALGYARQTNDSILCLEIQYAAAASSASADEKKESIRISRYLCDSMHMKRYAYDIVKYYLRSGQPDSARYYLDILAQDSTAKEWSNTQYTLWESQYLHALGRDRSAYLELLDLYNRTTARTEQQIRTQTYAIAQRYDNEAERAKNLQLELEKQHLYFSLAAIIALVLIAIIAAIIIWQKRHTRALLEKAQTRQKMALMREELELRRETLKRVIEQRVSMNKSLQEAILHQQKDAELPPWADEFIQLSTFTSPSQWNEFVEEFNACYEHVLSHLQEQYPDLKTVDIKVISLIILGIDNADICLLLGLAKNTVWNRRNRIKQAIGLDGNTNLDWWLINEYSIKRMELNDN
ncbi:MAG: hypothetical protein MST03_00515 [Bacteroidales bacterium]|nr:hypothetical protein [Bacteroidales bacterium]